MRYLFLCFLTFSTLHLFAQKRTDPNNQSEELGKISWYRDYQQALDLSKKETKPVLILFQEVPGCSTCRNYGHNVLSNTLMTDAIENEFIPLAIYNNKGGKDREVLNKYKEPTWNNPVVRIVNANGENIAQRVAGNYSAKGLYNAMIEALNKSNKTIPEYVKILGKELASTSSPKLKEDYYKMYCFWSGEGALGSVDGVLSTKAGFMNGEVVKVTYDSDVVSSEELEKFAIKQQMRPVAASNFRHSAKDEDYYLQHSSFKYIPLTEIQRTKINSALINKNNPSQYLSPTQKSWLKNKSSKEVLYNQDFEQSWIALNK